MRNLILCWKFPAITTFILISVFGFTGCSGTTNGTQGQGEAIFEDTFSPGTTGDWHTEADDLGSSNVVDGRMVIEVKAPNTIQFVTLQDSQFDDFDLSADLSMESGSLDSTMGIIYRMADPESFYRFEITGDGRYMIERLNPGGQWTRFNDDWELTTALNTGLNALNSLRIVADGLSLSFYANGEHLKTISADQASSGFIAFDAGTFSQPGVRASFDNLIINPIQ